MFLKSLEICGFKSFADRTVINFADGITALLGPNGCGKSNVVDAIKWVLAENKSKNLRADNMEDVIFNGTESRPPLSMAEVTLTIANENGLLPMQDDEIAIKRRLYRNKENEYYINGNQVTAQSVRKLFMDTGVGKAAYSVMEQGKIDQILSSKPEDRRYLFEEAAGISRSKAEVQEAERELERTRANLSQIEIGLAETKRNYETLKIQADKTAKYRKLKDEKFNYKLDIQLLRLKEFTQNQTRQEQNKKEIEEKRDAVVKELTAIFAEIDENTDKINYLSKLQTEKNQDMHATNAAIEGKKDMLKQLHAHERELKENIAQIENKISMVKERIDSYNEEIDSYNADLFEMNKRLEDLSKNIESFVSNIQLSSKQIDDNIRTIAANNGKINNLDEDRAKLQKDLEAITEDIVTELDAKLKDAGYSSALNRKAKENLDSILDQIKIFAGGRANIFKDFASLPNHSDKDAAQFGTDAVKAFTDLQKMLDKLSTAISEYTKTTPQFIDDFLSPEGIITKKRNIDQSIAQNLSQITAIKNENDELTKINSELNKKINEYKETLQKLRVNQASLDQQITSYQTQITQIKKSIATEEASRRDYENDLFQENARKEDMEEKIAGCEEDIAELELKGAKLLDEVNSLIKQIAEATSMHKDKESILNKKNQEKNKYQEQLERYSVSIAQTQTEIRNVKQNFQDSEGRDLMEFEERMYTITATPAQLKEKLAQTQQQMDALGSINYGAVEQFAEEKERYERQQSNYDDTKKTLENLVRVSEEIKTKSSEMFIETYNKIRKNFHNMFRRLFNGGRAELELSDGANVLTSGINIYAQPPGKKLEAISLLSGGEKTMTAVALLFATYQVRPSPFCLLDEIDAALDDKNVSSFVNTLRSFANVSQYIVITHNRKTVVAASTLLGITMQDSGITKVIQIRKDEDTLNGKIPYEEDNFVEEDVAPEEGIVIPPRPPRREHNPDGTLKVKGGENTNEN